MITLLIWVNRQYDFGEERRGNEVIDRNAKVEVGQSVKHVTSRAAHVDHAETHLSRSSRVTCERTWYRIPLRKRGPKRARGGERDA